MADAKKKGGGALDRLAKRANTNVLQEAPTVHIPLDKIDFDPNQPRIAFHAPDGLVAKSDQEALEELAALIKANGLIHPIVVAEKPDGRYLVRVGERRTRAHLLLGLPTIEARVRNDAMGIRALALQLAENKGRQDLTEMETARTIYRLITKSEENPDPMTKKQAAETVGISQGYVTRYVAYLDEALQEKWVKPGYLNTVETVYQMSILPESIQQLAYAELSTGKQESPLSWGGLTYYRNLAKNLSNIAANESAAAAQAALAAAQAGALGNGATNEPVSQVDAIAAALAGADDDGLVSGIGAGATAKPEVPFGGGVQDGYSLPAEAVQGLQVSTFQATDGVGASGVPGTVRTTPSVMSNTAVPCKMPVAVLKNLYAKFGDKIPELKKAVAEVRFTSGVAVDLVRELTGESVPEDVVLMKLAKALEALQE